MIPSLLLFAVGYGPLSQAAGILVSTPVGAPLAQVLCCLSSAYQEQDQRATLIYLDPRAYFVATYSWKVEPIPSYFFNLVCQGVLQGHDGCDSVVLEHVFLLLLLGQFLSLL